MTPPPARRLSSFGPPRRHLRRAPRLGQRQSSLLHLVVSLATCVGALSWSEPARAFTHIVQPGDTLASIAETFYGKIQHERLLVTANSLDVEGGIRIVPGMRLEVPAVTYIRVTEGQTWQQIAARLLGGEHRAHALAEANDSKAWLKPLVDAEVIVPYNLRFVCTGDETIVGLAYRFLGDRKKAWALDQYNDRKGRRLVRGEVVLIPITDLTLTDKGKQAGEAAQQLESLQFGGAARVAQAKVARGMDLLERDVRHGHYVEAVQRGTSFFGMGQLTKKQRARIARLLLEAYVALDARGLAKDSCAQWLEGDPSVKLDPDELSPKIIDVCKEVRP